MELEMNMNMFEIALDIPDVKIEKVEYNKSGDIIITVTSTKKGARCKHCNKKISNFHGYDRDILLRHLSILGRKTYIRIKPARYQCPYCDNGPTTTQRLEWYNLRSPHTKAYENHVLFSLINSTVEDVTIKEDIGYEAVMGIIKRNIEIEVNWKKIKRIDVLGLDEISLKKGHQDFVTIVSGLIGNELLILGVLKDRKKDTVLKFLKQIPARLRKQVSSVCSDMYDGFIEAAKIVFGKKVIIIDRFHVAKLYRKGFEELRKKEMKRLKKELSEKEYKKLKGVMWALRTAQKELTDEENKILECLFEHSPLLKIAYDISNELTEIFNDDFTKGGATIEINRWIKKVQKSGIECFDTFIKTLGKYFEFITNYFINRQTSGFVEGLNNKIKVIKRRCYGIINTSHLFQRIFIDLEWRKLLA